jgi:hypothetical protein
MANWKTSIFPCSGFQDIIEVSTINDPEEKSGNGKTAIGPHEEQDYLVARDPGVPRGSSRGPECA